MLLQHSICNKLYTPITEVVQLKLVSRVSSEEGPSEGCAKGRRSLHLYICVCERDTNGYDVVVVVVLLFMNLWMYGVVTRFTKYILLIKVESVMTLHP